MESAHELYKLLLEPIRDGWKEAKTLIVVTNGALGLLPLGLLPTEPIKVAPKVDGQPYFAAYRQVAWLARTHATVNLPSAGALRTLRNVPTPTAKREPLVGFGDPFLQRRAGQGDDLHGRSARCGRDDARRQGQAARLAPHRAAEQRQPERTAAVGGHGR